MSACFQIGLTIQGLLVVAFGLYRLLSQGLDPSPKLRLARQALLCAVCLPLVLAVVPSRHLPRLHLGESGTPIEFSRRVRQKIAKQMGGQRAVAPATMVAVPEPKWNPMIAFAVILSAVFALGMYWRARLFGRDLRQLHGLLKSSLVIRQIGRVRVVAHAGIAVPFSFHTPNWAWIVLPEDLALRPNDLRLAIRHELQHHRTRDTIWVYGIEALTIVMWINPFAHLWKRELNELQEIACDAALLGQSRVSVRGYADCLLRVAEVALESRTVFAGTTNMAAGSGNPARFQSFLGRRIAMLTKSPRPSSRWVAGLVGTFLSVCLLTAAYGSQQLLRGGVDDVITPGTASVDPAVQAIAEQSLEAAVTLHKASGGFAIVEEPSTGRILAVANIDRTAGFQPRSPHWALGRRFEPASIAKGLVAAEAIEQARVQPSDVLNCDQNGVYVYHGKTYRDWKKEGFGALSVTDTIAYSSNLCGIKIGEKLGAQGLDQMLRNFGFGPGGVAEHFPEARAGLLPNPDESGDSQYVPVVSTGYSLYVSPLEVLNAYSAIANGGILLQPVGATERGRIERKRVLSSTTAEEMSVILRRVVTDGTGKGHAESTYYTTAGKTASMYAPDHTGADEKGLVGSMNAAGFVGFAPVNQPKIAVYVAVFEPTDVDGAHGAYHAAPLFRDIVDRVLQAWNVAPDRKP